MARSTASTADSPLDIHSAGWALPARRVAERRRDRAQCFFRSELQAVKIKYFADTDTLYIEFKPGEVAETRDLDENMVLDVDAAGNICALTVEHASAHDRGVFVVVDNEHAKRLAA
jgi:uncharacterized protein YuzE